MCDMSAPKISLQGRLKIIILVFEHKQRNKDIKAVQFAFLFVIKDKTIVHLKLDRFKSLVPQLNMK